MNDKTAILLIIKCVAILAQVSLLPLLGILLKEITNQGLRLGCVSSSERILVPYIVAFLNIFTVLIVLFMLGIIGILVYAI